MAVTGASPHRRAHPDSRAHSLFRAGRHRRRRHGGGQPRFRPPSRLRTRPAPLLRARAPVAHRLVAVFTKTTACGVRPVSPAGTCRRTRAGPTLRAGRGCLSPGDIRPVPIAHPRRALTPPAPGPAPGHCVPGGPRRARRRPSSRSSASSPRCPPNGQIFESIGHLQLPEPARTFARHLARVLDERLGPAQRLGAGVEPRWPHRPTAPPVPAAGSGQDHPAEASASASPRDLVARGLGAGPGRAPGRRPRKDADQRARRPPRSALSLAAAPSAPGQGRRRPAGGGR